MSLLKKLSISMKIGVIKRYGVCLFSFQIVDRMRRQSSSASCQLCSHRRRDKTVSSRRRCVLGITYLLIQSLTRLFTALTISDKRGGNGRGEKRGSDGGKWGELEQGRRWAKAGALQVRLRQYWLILFNNQRLDKLRWFWPHHGLRTVEFKFSRILCHEWHNERLCRCSPGGVRKQRLLGNRRTVLLLGNKRHSARTEEPWTTVRRIHHRQRRRTCQLPRDVIVTSRWMTSSWHVLAVEGHVSYEEIVKLLRDEIGIRYAGK